MAARPAILIEHVFERERRGVGPHCSFCGTSTGPFREVEGLFTVLMCAGCQAARSSSSPTVSCSPTTIPGSWGCALCEYRAVEPQALEVHTAAEHPGWVARYEVVRPYPHQQLRVVYRQVEVPPAT
jgi:hypothetical protein